MNDPLLVSFVAAATEIEASAALAQLLEGEVAPVVARVLHSKLGTRRDEVAELTSAVRAEVIERLQGLRRRGDDSSIVNFRGYVAAVAYNTWAQYLRVERPGRAVLVNRLRYLLENRTSRRGFAIWDGLAGERWCGFAKWRSDSGVPSHNSKTEWLTSDPRAAAVEATGERGWSRMDLAELVTSLFNWLGGPIELRDLAGVLSELLEISDEKISLDDQHGDATPEPADGSAWAPDDELKWREYLTWLWKEIQMLSVPQRSAFLLHSEVTIELDFRGVATIRQIAAALEIVAEEFAALWSSLPLNDLVIAARLHLQRQQVINLRRVARDRLGAGWKKWIE